MIGPAGPRELRILDRLETLGLSGALHFVARTYAVDPVELIGRSRQKPIPAARHALWATLYLREDRGWSYPRIATLFEVDHSTVIAGVKAHEDRVLAALGGAAA